MRYKAMFLAGVAVGFVAGARAGREKYDQMVAKAQEVYGHPKVQQATSTVQARATEFGKTAKAKAPDYAKNARTTMSTQVPKFASAAKEKMPSRFGGRGSGGTTDGPDDVAQDGNLIYPADDQGSMDDGIRYTPDTP